MAAARSTPVATEAQARSRRSIHGGSSGAPMRYSVAVEMAADGPGSTELPVRRRSWRATLLGALVGLLIVMVLLMKWLMEYQVTAVAERRAQEAVAREAVARCFELTTPRAVDACRKAQAGDDRVGAKLTRSDSGEP